MTTEPLTDDRLAEIGIRAAHLHEFVALPPEADQLAGKDVPAMLAEVRRVQGQRKFLLGQIAKKDAASGAGDRALAEFLGGEPEEPTRRLEDGSTHTVQALTDAGEACVQQECVAAREEKRLRQEQYSLRAAVDGVLDEVGYMADADQITPEVAGQLRQMLRDALGLDRPLPTTP